MADARPDVELSGLRPAGASASDDPSAAASELDAAIPKAYAVVSTASPLPPHRTLPHSATSASSGSAPQRAAFAAPAASASAGVGSSGACGFVRNATFQFWLFAAIVLCFGLAVGLVIGVTVRSSRSDDAGAAITAALPVVELTIVNTTLSWNGRAYPRKALRVTGDAGSGAETVSGVASYVLPSVAATFNARVSNALYGDAAEETTLHAHGHAAPSVFDGVPFISTTPIAAAGQQQVSWPLSSAASRDGLHAGGTYFVHAHFGFHHAEGVAAPFIVRDAPPTDYPLRDSVAAAADAVVVLQDFCAYCNVNDSVAAASLSPAATAATDCTVRAIIDCAVESHESAAAATPFAACPTAGAMAARRMHMRFRAHTANGAFIEAAANDGGATVPVVSVAAADAADDMATSVRVRVINSAADTNYRLELTLPLDGGRAIDPDQAGAVVFAFVIAVDGHWVVPVPWNTAVGSSGGLWIGVAQRVDLLLQFATADAAASNPVLVRAREESDGSAPAQSLSAGVVVGGPAAGADAALLTRFSTALRALQSATEPIGWWPDEQLQEQKLRAWPGTGVPDVLTRPFDRVLDVNLTGHGGVNGHNYYEYPAVPFARNPYPLRVRYGERVALRLFNLTPDPHAMHLHGHALQLVSVDGAPFRDGDGAVTAGALRDTVLLPGGCHSAVAVFDALNPGVHELHCHMSVHMAAGMITTLEYAV